MIALVALAVTAATTPAAADVRLVQKPFKLTLGPMPAAPPIQLTRPPPLKITSMLTLAAGAATIGVSIFLGIHSLDLRRAAREYCRDSGCEPRGYELSERSGDFREAATVTAAAGAALLLAGGLLLFLGQKKPGIPRMDNTQAGVRIVPGLGRVDLKGTF
jgi:hypothetical protein